MCLTSANHPSKFLSGERIFQRYSPFSSCALSVGFILNDERAQALGEICDETTEGCERIAALAGGLHLGERMHLTAALKALPTLRRRHQAQFRAIKRAYPDVAQALLRSFDETTLRDVSERCERQFRYNDGLIVTALFSQIEGTLFRLRRRVMKESFKPGTTRLEHDSNADTQFRALIPARIFPGLYESLPIRQLILDYKDVGRNAAVHQNDAFHSLAFAEKMRKFDIEAALEAVLESFEIVFEVLACHLWQLSMLPPGDQEVLAEASCSIATRPTIP